MVPLKNIILKDPGHTLNSKGPSFPLINYMMGPNSTKMIISNNMKLYTQTELNGLKKSINNFYFLPIKKYFKYKFGQSEQSSLVY